MQLKMKKGKRVLTLAAQERKDLEKSAVWCEGIVGDLGEAHAEIKAVASTCAEGLKTLLKMIPEEK
jgi:hypothetical protein